MKISKFYFLITFVIFNLSTNAHCKENLAYINLDEIIKKSNYGIEILNEINLLNDKNISQLQQMEDELKLNENDLNNKKNVLSQNDYENELSKLKKKILKYREIKNEMTKNFEEQKNKNLNIFFSKINPLIQEYMDEQSIDILLSQENIFIGKKSADITNKIIEIINTKLK